MHVLTRGLTFTGVILAGLSSQAKELGYYNANDAAPARSNASGSVGLAADALPMAAKAPESKARFMWAARGPEAYRAKDAVPQERAREYLRHYASELGLSAVAVAQAGVAAIHDLGGGAQIVQFSQNVGGVDVYRSRMNVLTDRSGRLIAISGELFPEVARQQPLPFKLSHAEAVAKALGDFYSSGTSARNLKQVGNEQHGYRSFTFASGPNKGLLSGPARAKQVYFRLGKQLVAAYYAEFIGREVGPHGTNEGYALILDAGNGAMLARESITADAAFKYRVWAEADGDKTPLDGPTADYTPHVTGVPDGSKPGALAPNLVEMDGFNTPQTGVPDAWLAPASTETKGNNVDAYSDRDQLVDADGNVVNDGFNNGDMRATVTAPGVFDRTYDVTKPPAEDDDQIMAAVTQIFYVNNWLHDYWYDRGFDEKSGNGQRLNFSRGGQENDAILAEAQDSAIYGERDNANMSTPADGSPPRMQMYVWNNSDLTRTITIEPKPAAFTGETGSAAFGPTNFEVTAEAVLANDATDPKSDGCEALPDVTGKIVVAEAGLMGSPTTCRGSTRGKMAQDAGAVGLVYISAAAPAHLGPNPALGITIPALTISRADGDLLLTQLTAGTTTITLQRDMDIELDGTIDNQIVAHEWGHYCHHRLVSCGGTSCGGMSEGWGDYIAMHMTLRPTDKLDGVFGMAGYATASLSDNPFYYGIRRTPYSTDIAKNGLSFRHVTNDVPLPTGDFLANASPNVEPHNQGEVWTTIMHEVHVSLLQRSTGATPAYTWKEAHDRMGKYIVAGMKMAPSEPSYTEQRDGILAAALLAGDTADFDVMAAAFAKRGLGSCAIAPAPSSPDNADAVESIEVKGNMQFASAILDDSGMSCDEDGRLDVGETGKLTVTVQNAGALPLKASKVKVTTDSPVLKFTGTGEIEVPELGPLQAANIEFEATLLATATATELSKIAIAITAPDSCVAAIPVDLVTRVNSDTGIDASASDDVQADQTAWSAPPIPEAPAPLWNRASLVANDETVLMWWGQDAGFLADSTLVSPALEVGTAPFIVEFEHAYSFETGADAAGMPVYYDGGVIEFSVDNGATWADVTTAGAVPGYIAPVGDPTSKSNPLSGRPGFVSASAGILEPVLRLEPLKLDFGTMLQGKSVLLRFRIGTDEGVGDVGWLLDNFKVSGITNTPFTTVGNDTGHCDGGSGGMGGADGGTGGTAGKGGSGGLGGTAGVGGSTGGTGAIGGAAGTGTGDDTGDDGCGCSVPGESPTRGSLAALLLALPLWLRRRAASRRKA